MKTAEPRKKGLELMGRRCGRDEANEAQSGEEETKTRPRRAKIGSTWGQDGAKTGPRRSKMKPRGSQDEAKNGSKTGQDRAKIGPRQARAVQDRPKVGQKCAKK